ncbi:hypothetical protein PQX77_009357 [Marasmius sp. AFHP31]|nr:hypothetical protein PQX77_009357 [Marasmius sp. AFHP31]
MGRQQFQQANGNINNYYLANKGSSSTQGEDEKRLMPIQDQFREFRRGDIIIRSEVHSSEMMMNIVTKFKLTNPFQPLRMVKIRRKMCSVELVNFRDCKFTLFLFEPENKEDKDMVAIIWKQIYDGLSTHTYSGCVNSISQPLYYMMVWTSIGKGESIHEPNWIVELANGDDFIDRFDNGKNKVVAVYLLYTLASSIQVLGVEFSVSDEEADWNFNLKTLSWQYDIAPTSVLLPDDLSIWGFFRIPPLCQNTLPQLQINEIIAWSQQHFNDFLCLIATFIEITYRDFNLSEFASRGLLTFGAVVHRQKGIIAHFPSLPSPEQSLENFSRDICASYSKEVPSRINFKFCRPGNLVMSFEVRLPTRFVAAYLGQSSPFVHNLEHPEDDIVFINKIWILLVGTFLHDPTTQSTPVFLFIPPIPVENINGVYCVRYPLPEQLFYWSLDTDGKDAILEKDWEKYGVPKLGTEINIASEWDSDICTHIWEYLLSRNYNLDGKQYARDHGYPELMRGDPHDIWFQAESFSLVELFGEDQPDNDSGATKVVDLIVSNTRLDSRVHSEISIEDGAVNTANISIRQGISSVA